MISVDWRTMQNDIAQLYTSFQALPSYIAKKHLKSAMRKAIVASRGVQLLRQNTPPTSTRRGRRKKGEKAKSTGELRRSVTTKAKWIGKNTTGAAVAGLGYKYNSENRKAIWNEFGTTRMAGRHMMQRTFESIRGTVKSNLESEMAKALESAARELASGKNPGMSARGIRMGL